MTAATITGLAIRQLLVERGDWLFIGVATATGTSTTIIDTEYMKGIDKGSGLYDGCTVRMASGTRVGEQSNVDFLDNTTGTITVTRAFSGATAQGDIYEIWLRGIDPVMVDRLKDDCLQKFCSQWRVQALSWINDGDLDSAGVTNWTAAGGATRTKGFSQFPHAHSRRELSVVHTTAATDYVKTDAVNCQPGERIFLQVPVRAYVTATPASPATASIVVTDESNGSATIPIGGIKTSHIGIGSGWISILFTIPANCYQFRLRLMSDTANSTTVWGGFACHKRQKMRWSYPDRVTTKKRTGRIYTTNQINPAQSEQSDFVFKLPDFRRIERVQVGSQVELYVQPGLAETPIYWYERGYFDRLCTDYNTGTGRAAGDAATTDCVKEYIAAKLARQVSKWMLDKYGADWQDDWVRASADDDYWEGQMGPEPQMIEEGESSLIVPQFRI